MARGIDIDSLECVVNFDIPRDSETYTHRAGRTGRMGKEGYMLSLSSLIQKKSKLKKFASIREIVLKTKNSISNKAPLLYTHPVYGAFYKQFNFILICFQKHSSPSPINDGLYHLLLSPCMIS